MKYILTSLLCFLISFNLFSMPEGELKETEISSQDSIYLAVNRMEFSSAIVIIDRVLSGELDSIQLRHLSLQKVRCLKKLYRFNDAVKLLAEMYERSFTPASTMDVEVMSELADSYISLGDIDSAISTYYLLKTAFPGNLYYAIRCANLLYRLEMFEDVISEGKGILGVDSTHYSVLSLIGDSFNKIEKSDSALVYYNKMLRINPMDFRVIDKKSKILLAKKKYSEVMELTEDYLSKDSVNLVVNSIYGLALHLDTQYEESIDVYMKLISFGDSTYNTNYCLGLNYYMLNNYFEAEGYFEKAFKSDSSDVNLVYHYAISTTWQSYRVDRTTKLLDYAYSLTQPDSTVVGMVYSGYATSYYKLKKYKDAIPYYIKAYKYNSAFISALSALGYCYEKEKDLKRAKEYYEAYLRVANKLSTGYRIVESRLEVVKGDLFMIEN